MMERDTHLDRERKRFETYNVSMHEEGKDTASLRTDRRSRTWGVEEETS